MERPLKVSRIVFELDLSYLSSPEFFSVVEKKPSSDVRVPAPGCLITKCEFRFGPRHDVHFVISETL